MVALAQVAIRIRGQEIMKRNATRSFVPVFLCLGLCLALLAQSVSQISGTVKDASGSAIPGAEVTVTQTDTGVTRTAQTDANGIYSLPSLPLGPYRLEVKKEGFSTYVQSGIVLQVDTAPTIDPVMKIGALTETVQVEAAAAMVAHLAGLNEDEKSVFRTGFEIDQRWLIELAADRTPFICQSQSLNLFLPADINKWDLHMLHWTAWERGIKSLYYCRSKSISRAGFAGQLEKKGAKAVAETRTDYEECLACQ